MRHAPNDDDDLDDELDLNDNRSDDGEAEEDPFISPADSSAVPVARSRASKPSPSSCSWRGVARALRCMCVTCLAVVGLAAALYGTFRVRRAQEIDRVVELPFQRLEVRDVPSDDLAAWVDAMWTLKLVSGASGRWKYGAWYKSYDEFVLLHWEDVGGLRCGASNASVHSGPLFIVYHSLFVAEFEAVVRRVLLHKKMSLGYWLVRLASKDEEPAPIGMPSWDWVVDEVDAPRSLPGHFQEQRGSGARSAFSKGLSPEYFGSARGALLDGLFSGWWVSKARNSGPSNEQGFMRSTRITGTGVQRFPTFCRDPRIWSTALSPRATGANSTMTPAEALTCAGAADFGEWSRCSGDMHRQLHHFVGGAIMCDETRKTTPSRNSSSADYYVDETGVVVKMPPSSSSSSGGSSRRRLRLGNRGNRRRLRVRRRADAAEGGVGFGRDGSADDARGGIVGDFGAAMSSVNDPVFFFAHSYFDGEFFRWVASTHTSWATVARGVGTALEACRRDPPVAKHRYRSLLLLATGGKGEPTAKLEKHLSDFARRVSSSIAGGGGEKGGG